MFSDGTDVIIQPSDFIPEAMIELNKVLGQSIHRHIKQEPIDEYSHSHHTTVLHNSCIKTEQTEQTEPQANNRLLPDPSILSHDHCRNYEDENEPQPMEDADDEHSDSSLEKSSDDICRRKRPGRKKGQSKYNLIVTGAFKTSLHVQSLTFLNEIIL